VGGGDTLNKLRYYLFEKGEWWVEGQNNLGV